MPGIHSEHAFEDAIEASLSAGGWLRGTPSNYDASLALDPVELFEFIGQTQPKAWSDLITRRGGDEATTKTKFTQRLIDEINRRGTIDLLRRGFTDVGVKFELAYFRPAHSLTPDLVAKYEANRCVVTRQLPYSPVNNNTLDITLFVNGLPTATAEIKNALTGQNVNNAIAQYRTDRDPKDQLLSRRAVVHFAIDTDLVFLTTRLAGKATQFLPFNQGGTGGGGGNPEPHDASRYKTSYLFEEVWQRDSWLDILAKFTQTEVIRDERGRERDKKIIFPRYHQLDAVRKALRDVATRGPGISYLFEHSPGSGKTNTIAWLTYRLSSLHDANNEKIFAKVIVITDRVALDRQLQDAIFQFDHTPGVVQKIDQNSSQLAEALQSGGAQIIITTLQKFPYVIEKMEALQSQSFAIVIDEAHSSQTGETHKALKQILGAGGDSAADLTETEFEDGSVEDTYDEQDVIAAAIERSATARSRQSHLSYFAFTATPKARTLELFGTQHPDGYFRPFHLYAMRQAIEEGFILDVLANYTTYKTYWNLAKHVSEDPEVPEREAAVAIARYVSLHPSNLAQKTEIIVEHFRRHTRGKIGGRAKAMVVTRSRLHAVRYKIAFDAYIKEKGYSDLQTLVAFSGTVIDPDTGESFTESGFNHFSEANLPKQFESDDYQVLIVAEKYQTGYDQPLLHTMYVDKKLAGIKAVQTLCRLNRITENKIDTFILDFANEAAEIQEAFRPFYDTPIAQPTDPNILYTVASRVEDAGVVAQGEVTEFAGLLLASDSSPKARANAHARLYGLIQPAVDRAKALEAQAQEDFRQSVISYVRLYAFLSQVLPWADPHLEGLYLYSKALMTRLPRPEQGSIDLGDDVTLTHLRTQLISEAENLSLVKSNAEEVEVPGFGGDGAGSGQTGKDIQLSLLIETLNERFGTEFTKADQLWFDQLAQSMIEDSDLEVQAKVNTIENYGFGFDKSLLDHSIQRRDSNEAIFAKLMNDGNFQDAVKKALLPIVYETQRNGEDG